MSSRTPWAVGLFGVFLLSLAGFALKVGLGGPAVFLAGSVVALLVTLWMLYRAAWALAKDGGVEDAGPALLSERRRKDLQREHLMLKRALKELELDHGMGKLSDADYQEIRGRFRERAKRIMRQLDQGQDYQKQIERDLQARRAAQAQAEVPPAAPAGGGTCGKCGTRNDPDAAFCKKCGTALSAP